jgi:hypothetical protein
MVDRHHIEDLGLVAQGLGAVGKPLGDLELSSIALHYGQRIRRLYPLQGFLIEEGICNGLIADTNDELQVIAPQDRRW